MLVIRPEVKKHFVFVSLFVLIVIIAISAYAFISLQKIKQEEKEIKTEILPLTRILKDQELRELAEKEVVHYPAKTQQISQACLVVPLEQNIMQGISSWEQVNLLPEEKYKQGKNLFYNFSYEGVLKDFQYQEKNGCWYYQLTMEKNGVDYLLNIPKGAVFTGDFSPVSPDFLQEYVGHDLLLRIQYFSANQQDFSPLKFMEWEIKELGDK